MRMAAHPFATSSRTNSIAVRIVWKPSEKAAMALIAHQPADRFWIGIGDLTRDREIMILFLPQPAEAVGVDQPHARFVGAIGAAAMPDRAQIDQRRSLRHRRLDRFFFHRHARFLPSVTAEDHVRAAILERE